MNVKDAREYLQTCQEAHRKYNNQDSHILVLKAEVEYLKLAIHAVSLALAEQVDSRRQPFNPQS